MKLLLQILLDFTWGGGGGGEAWEATLQSVDEIFDARFGNKTELST